jgi:DNA repair exonuclease SbcCD ATPase subunit
MIQFDKLEITNFLSWGDKQTVPLYKQGIVRVEGINKDEPSADSNMAGKSSIVEALLWCLYARTIRNVRHDAVVNRHAKNNCCVSLHFRHGDVHYVVSRYRKHKLHRNRLLLFRGSTPLSYRHGDDTQAKLESILGCDYEAFAHTTIFGGPRPFALLTDAEQKKVLESFLHFEKFEIALRRTKQLLSETLEKEHGLEIKTVKLRGDVDQIKIGRASCRERV